ncbi:MAG: tetratricopeptide repeat protein [Gammaproteobacteria bacterium]
MLLSLTTPAWADARADGDKGIAEYRKGNLIASIQLLEKSAAAGYTPAQVTLAYIYDQSENDDAAFHWYQKAANSKDAAGLYGLGNMYAKGEGTGKNPARAGQLILQSAQLDYLPAIRAYAFALENGQLGFDSDPATAAHWYLKAAELGDGVSIRRLRDAYQYGQLGLPIDAQQSAQWDAKINAKE